MPGKQEDRSQRGSQSRGRPGDVSRTSFEDQSVDELRQMAKQLGIQDRDNLDREQLIERIQNENQETEQRSAGPAEQGTGETSSSSTRKNRP